ncbi:MAG: hypothetical protein ACOC70_01530 [bacterium]
MNNFRTVVTVLVVLLAFTCFQLIANYSLRRAVREDVHDQIEKTESARAELIEYEEELAKATERLDELVAALEQVAGQAEAARQKSEKLSVALDAVAAKLEALKTRLDEIEKKVGPLGKAADAAAEAHARLESLDERLTRLAGGLSARKKQTEQALARLSGRLTEQRELAEKNHKHLGEELATLRRAVEQADAELDSAGKDAARALDLVGRLSRSFEERRSAIKASTLAAMRKDIQEVQGEITRLAEALDAAGEKGGGT